MDLEEVIAREAIRHTLASYNMAGDRLQRDRFLGNFTREATFEFTTRQGEQRRFEGIEAIRSWFDGLGTETSPFPVGDAPMFVRHHLSTCLIELTGAATARSRTYFTNYTPIGLDHAGVYADRFEKTQDRWLIAQRSVRVDWYSPNSVVPA